jgi:hypothetical protein
MTIIMVTGLQDWKYMQQQNRLYEFVSELSTNYNIIPETISLFFLCICCNSGHPTEEKENRCESSMH